MSSGYVRDLPKWVTIPITVIGFYTGCGLILYALVWLYWFMTSVLPWPYPYAL